MDDKKEYSVLEQFVSEAAQLLGKKLVDLEGDEDEGSDGIGGDVVKSDSNGDGNVRGNRKSGVKNKPVPKTEPAEKVETATADTPEASEDSVELDLLDKPQLVTFAAKYGIAVEQKWTADKLRQVIAKAMGVQEEKSAEEPATTASSGDKKTGKPKVGDFILVNEDNGVWGEYEVTAVRGNGIFTKKWQLTVEDEGTDWKHKE